MTLNDPLLKSLKEHLKPLLQLNVIPDNNSDLKLFCEVVEKIFYNGVTLRQNKIPPPWAWMNAVACEMERGTITRVFPYVRSVESTRDCQKVTTDTGKFRQLVRSCLKFKCLHVPAEVMVRQIGEKKLTWYQGTSVLGHEVLGEILLSVLLQVSQLEFDVDIDNARFLDYCWQIPDKEEITFVPCESLGLVIAFHAHLAVIVALEKWSVAAEENKIEAGDILDELNGQVLTDDMSGKLKGILGKCRNQPISVRVVKTHVKDATRAFAPCLSIYTHTPYLSNLCPPNLPTPPQKLKRREMEYIGCSSVGSRGDVSVIEKGIGAVVGAAMAPRPRPVRLECRELDISVYCGGHLLMRHCYINVASCAHSTNYPTHFAYIVGDGPCSRDTQYTCHVFTAGSRAACANTLLDISAGFARTHCAA